MAAAATGEEVDTRHQPSGEKLPAPWMVGALSIDSTTTLRLFILAMIAEFGVRPLRVLETLVDVAPSLAGVAMLMVISAEPAATFTLTSCADTPVRCCEMAFPIWVLTMSV